VLEDLDLTGRRVLVTGASRGIGAEVASVLAQHGARLVLVARDGERLRGHARTLPGEGHSALAFDVADEEAWRAAQQEGALARIDGVVSAAAALTPVGPIGSYEPRELWRTLQVNVYGTFLAVHTCLPTLEAGGGAVVTFAGGGATAPQPRYDAYATSKAAVVRLTENIACELAGRGVRCNAVSPGFVATEIHAATLRAGAEVVGEDYFATTTRQLEQGGVPARDGAELTAFLLGEGAQGITGKLISAPWDPWREESFRQRLREEPDLATVRRIDDQFFATLPRVAISPTPPVAPEPVGGTN
jgi:NAD(P)-dependent dehydrogenase (short-subunit alcohol dehydrogenase family)